MNPEWGSYASYERGKSVKKSTDKVSSIDKNEKEIKRRDTEILQKFLPQWKLKNALNEKKNWGLKKELLESGFNKIYSMIEDAQEMGMQKFKEIQISEWGFKIILSNTSLGIDWWFPLKWLTPALQELLKKNINDVNSFLNNRSKNYIADLYKKKKEAKENDEKQSFKLLWWELKTFLSQQRNSKLKEEFLKKWLENFYKTTKKAREEGDNQLDEKAAETKILWGVGQLRFKNKNWDIKSFVVLESQEKSWISKELYDILDKYEDDYVNFLSKKARAHLNWINKNKTVQNKKKSNPKIQTKEAKWAEKLSTIAKYNLSEKEVLEEIKGKNITNSTKKYLDYFRNILRNKWISKEEVWLLKKLNNFYNYLTKKEALTEDTESIIKWKATNEEKLAKIIDHLSTYIKRNEDLLKKKQKSSWTEIYTSKNANNLERDKIQKKIKEKELEEQQIEKKTTTNTEVLEQNNDKKIMDSTAGTTEKTDFIKELDNLPQEDILKNIPKETYKEYLEAFKKSPEVEALKFENNKLKSLLSKLFIKDKSDPDLIKLQKVRATSPIREEMITSERQQFQQIIKEKAELTALKSWKVLFEKLGISAINWKVIQKAEGKSYYQYSDANNPKVSYQFTPITGEFSISTNNINDETRSIDITGTKQKKLFKIPGFTELMNQADPKTILPDKRLDSYKEIKQVIETKLGENIQHNLWDTEATSIKHEIEKEQLETGIITKIKSGLGLKKEQLNKNTDPGYYSFFAPILKTFKQPNISTNQLKILKQFADRIGERGQFTEWKTPTETNEVVQYTDFKKHIETPRNLIKYALSWEKIRQVESLQNNREKSKFTIGKIMNRLEKSWGKGGPNDRILDIEKVSTLVNLRESPDITRNKEYQSSYNKLLSDIESEYLRQVEPTVRKEEVAYADNVILPKIQNTPA